VSAEIKQIHCMNYLYSDLAGTVKDLAVQSRINKVIETIDAIKSAVAGAVDVRVIRADLNERYLPGLNNSVSSDMYAQVAK